MGKRIIFAVIAVVLVLTGCSHKKDAGTNTIVLETIAEAETFSIDNNIMYVDNTDNFYNLNRLIGSENIFDAINYGADKILTAEPAENNIEFNLYTVGIWEKETLTVGDNFSDTGILSVELLSAAPLVYVVELMNGYYIQFQTDTDYATYQIDYGALRTKYGVVYHYDGEICYLDFRDDSGYDGLPAASTISCGELQFYWYDSYDMYNDVLYVSGYDSNEDLDFTYAVSLEDFTYEETDFMYETIYYGEGYSFSVNYFDENSLQITKGEENNVLIDCDIYTENFDVVDNRFIIICANDGIKRQLRCFDTKTMDIEEYGSVIMSQYPYYYGYMPDIGIFTIDTRDNLGNKCIILWDAQGLIKSL